MTNHFDVSQISRDQSVRGRVWNPLYGNAGPRDPGMQPNHNALHEWVESIPPIST